MKPQPDKQHILNSLAAIARGAGRAPSRSEFILLSGISEDQVSRCFPTWNDAVRAAGLQPHTLNMRVEDRELLEAWGSAVRRNRKIPARRTYHHIGKFDHRTIERRFGSWSKLPEVFRNFAQDKPEWADVLALLPTSTPKPSPQRAPDPSPNNDHAPHRQSLSRSCLTSGFSGGSRLFTLGSEGQPCRKAEKIRVLTPEVGRTNNLASYEMALRPSSSKIRYPSLYGRPTYGKPMDFRGLRHEPVNEQGVVLLFGMVAKELGYTVESVQSGFPDCEAKRQTAPQRWQRVQIEFEFESRNFRDHGHSLTGCDIIVCWRHNWPDCPPHIEILELSSLVQALPMSGG